MTERQRACQWARELRAAQAQGLARRQAVPAAYGAAYQEIRRRMFAEAKAHPEGVRCGICGEPVRPGEQWVTDDIVPASDGGASTRDNLQLAHFACNLRRGAQLGAKRVRGTAPGEGASFDVIPHPYETEGVSNMLGFRKKGESTDCGRSRMPIDCKIVKADPGFEPEWQEMEEGHWRGSANAWSEDIVRATRDDA